MKAKQYFERYVNEWPDKSNDWKVIKTLQDIFIEAQEIAKTRNAKTDSAYQAIFKELNTKANAFVRMVNETDGLQIRHNAFMYFVEAENPEFFKMIYPNGHENHASN